MVLGLISPIIGVVALLVSLQSFKTARQALETSQQSLKIGQRAYLSVLEVRYADSKLQIHLRNSGNTPARIMSLGLHVVVIGQARLFNLESRWFQNPLHVHLDEVNRLSKSIGLISETTEIGGKGDGWFNVLCDARNFTDDLPESIAMAALIQYRDVFNDPHPLISGWRMKDLTFVGELSPFSAEVLLVSRFPGVVDLSSNEHIYEYNPDEYKARAPHSQKNEPSEK